MQMLLPNKINVLLFSVLIVTLSLAAARESYDDVVDSILENIKSAAIQIGEKPFTDLSGLAKLSDGYNLTVRMADVMFSGLHGSKRVTNIPVKGSGIEDFYQLQFVMETPFADETTFTAAVFSSEPYGNKPCDPDHKPDECNFTATCESHVKATLKKPFQVRVYLEIEIASWGRIQVKSLSIEKDAKYLTTFESCNIHKSNKCTEFGKWMDQNLWLRWNFRLKDTFKSILEKVRLPGM